MCAYGEFQRGNVAVCVFAYDDDDDDNVMHAQRNTYPLSLCVCAVERTNRTHDVVFLSSGGNNMLFEGCTVSVFPYSCTTDCVHDHGDYNDDTTKVVAVQASSR